MQRSALEQSASLVHSGRLQPSVSNSNEPHPSDLHVSSRLHHDGGGDTLGGGVKRRQLVKSHSYGSAGSDAHESNSLGSVRVVNSPSQTLPSDFLMRQGRPGKL